MITEGLMQMVCQSKAVQDELHLAERNVVEGNLCPREASLRVLQKLQSQENLSRFME
jgi:hypothetical protein